MSLGEMTPNSLINGERLPFRLLAGKGVAPSSVDSQAIAGLPLSKGGMPVGMLGCGDWDKGRSSEGTVVFDLGRVVIKIPCGTITRSVPDWARAEAETMEGFKGVSPKTMVIIARLGDGQPRPVIVQEKVEGSPICDVPWETILSVRVLAGLKQIISCMRRMYLQEGVLDPSGQRFTNKLAAAILGFIPFFSDNIMISKSGEVHFTDNVPERVPMEKSGRLKRLSRQARLVAAERLVDFLWKAVTLADNLGEAGKSKRVVAGEPLPFHL